MQTRDITNTLSALVSQPGYRHYLRRKLMTRYGYIPKTTRRAARRQTSSHLPDSMAAPISQLAARLAIMPEGHLSNPVSLLGLTIGYFNEQQFRYLFNEVFVEACYWFRTNRAAPVIIDCGSNIGMSVLFFKTLYPHANLIGFEPDPATFGQLTENVRANALNDVALHNIALSDKDGDLDFFISPEEQGSLLMSVHQERLPGEKITVPAKRLSTFIPDHVDLLKIDIEGSEANVLAELDSSGVMHRIERIHLEYHHHLKPTKDGLSEILGVLERNDFGYQIRAHWGQGLPKPGTFQDIAIFAYGPRERYGVSGPYSLFNTRSSALA